MNILTFDTSGDFCTVAVAYKGQNYYESLALTFGHAIHLVPMIMRLMHRAQAQFTDLDLISVVNGPGSFTGIRVGIAAAHGLSLASALPLITISAFEFYAYNIPPQTDSLVIIDSRRGDLFVQHYRGEFDLQGSPQILKPDAINIVNYSLTGNGLKLLDPQYQQEPNPEALISISRRKRLSGEFSGLREDCKPLYLREPDATCNKNSKI